jgi:hypothetical protein
VINPVEAFMQANGMAVSAFAPGSRYAGIATAQRVQDDGRTVVFLRRRFLPAPERFAPLQVVTIVAGDRLDNLAARHLGVADQWWRLCDANRAMQPEALVATAGATLLLTLPEDVPGGGGNDGG